VLKNLEEAHSNLEMNHSSLFKERDLMQNHAQELELLLNSKIEEHASAIKSHEKHTIDLETQISKHISEKTDLVSQMKTFDHTIEAISSQNCELEKSLSDVNAEVEDMKKKLKECEESCQSLVNQKSALILEKNNLLSQVPIQFKLTSYGFYFVFLCEKLLFLYFFHLFIFTTLVSEKSVDYRSSGPTIAISDLYFLRCNDL
jgi:chromosome segregation ATPase